MFPRRFIGVLAFGWLVAACSGAAPDSSSGFSDDPSAVVESTKGRLHAALYTSPSTTPVRGNNQVQLALFAGEVSSKDEAQLTDLDVQLTTLMPAMGHGGPKQPELVAIEGDRYVFHNVVLNMPGRWQLRVSVSGEINDQLVFEFDVD
jgi:hypothetical protein